MCVCVCGCGLSKACKEAEKVESLVAYHTVGCVCAVVCRALCSYVPAWLCRALNCMATCKSKLNTNKSMLTNVFEAREHGTLGYS